MARSQRAAGMYCAGAFVAFVLTVAAAVGWYWTGI
jgi:hypothetical protein